MSLVHFLAPLPAKIQFIIIFTKIILIVRYQKQLQLNYVSMYKRNKLLETELEDLRKTTAAITTSHTSSKSAQQQLSSAASEKNNNHHTSSKSGIFDMSSSLTSSSGGKKTESGGLGSALSGSSSSIQKPLGHVSSAKAKLLSKFSSKFSDN